MESLYVVELDISHPDRDDLLGDTQSRLDVLLGHTARWIDPSSKHNLTAESFGSDGSLSVVRRPHSGEASLIQWMRIDSPTASALRLQVIDDLAEGAGKFYSTVTIARLGDRVIYRHALAKESLDGILQPTRVEDLERPGLVRSILQDRSIRCSSQGMIVEGRYQLVRDDNDLNWLIALLRGHKRPPVLVVDTVRKERISFAKETAQRLAGLVQVYAIPAVPLITKYNESNPEWAVPFSGARLLWPGKDHRNPTYFENETDHRSVSSMLRLLAGVSVAARGFDFAWTRANRSFQAHQSTLRAADADKRLQEALASSDLEEQIAVLRSELELERRDHESTRAELDQFIEDFDAPDRGQLERELASTRYRLQVAQEEVEELRRLSGAVNLDEAPDLSTQDLTPLARFLEDVSSRAVVFTPTAIKSWGRSGYPRPDRMRNALIALTKSAVQWQALNGAIGQSRTEWMKTEFELNVAYHDDGLISAGKDEFTFDGKTWSRVPHVKLDDHVAPNEVGRVYFAEDPDGRRFIIDHVGLKLYGI